MKIAMLVLILTGCQAIDEFLNMETLEIVNYSPSEKIVNYSAISEVTITFSEEMNKSRTEDSFSLTKDSSAVQGNYRWKGKTLVFTPLRIENNSAYMIELTTEAEDKYGNSLREKFVYSFSTAAEDENPVFISSSPADRATITDPLHPVTIVFSEAIADESLYSAFSIFPDIRGAITFEGGNTEVIFTPLEKYETGTDYTVSISDRLEDLFGNRIAEKFEIFFSMGNGEEGEIIWFGDSDDNEYSDTDISIVNQNIEKGVVLKLCLDSEAGETMKKSPVTVSPSSSYSEEWNPGFTECLIKFENPLVYDEIYEIQSGQKLYRLHINGPSSRPPVLEKVLFCNDSAAPVFEELTLNKGINFQTSDSAFFDFYFTLSQGAALSDTAIFNSVDFRTVNGDLSVNPLRVVNPASTASPSPLPSAGQYIFRIECSVTAGTKVSPFRIEVDTELTDTLLNAIKEEAVVQVTSL